MLKPSDMEKDRTENSEVAVKKSIVDTKMDKAASNLPPESAREAKTAIPESAAPEREPSVKDYIRVFGYAKKWDIVLMIAAAIGSAGAGVTMPLMIVVFGELVTSFTGYGGPDTKTQQDFDAALNQGGLYMFALFIARFGLSYVTKV